ncbi:MAG: chromosomal replication initiator protein DnaA [Planctomycetes bacterium]|nr:chromosomal replication initiator protein DnaA [Planctomycetota bacterium]
MQPPKGGRFHCAGKVPLVMPISDEDLHTAMHAYLRRNNPEICRHWFDRIAVLGIERGVLRLLVDEPVRLKYLQRTCLAAFTEAVQSVTGQLLAVRFIGPDGLGGEQPQPTTNHASGSMNETSVMLDEQMVLSPDYSFDGFVVGPGNRLAHAAAMAVASKLGRAYNPFFVHGGVGLGKTHLLQAICQQLLRQQPTARISYISCSTFMDAFHDCVKAGRMGEFRHRFRNVDLLVIDDIHFLSKHEQTQEEFFHTFNALHQSGRQIVLSSDAAPAEIPDLEERLVSRFNSGLVARMERPCYETRVNILKAKARLHNLQMPDDVPAYVAARIDSNIRELEGALTKVRGLAMATGREIDLELAKEAIGGDPLSQGRGNPQPNIQAILDAVVRYYDIKLTDLLGKRRHKSVALPRQVCMWLARRHTRYSLEEIGGYLGGRDHTTVLHAIRQVDTKQTRDERLKADVDRIQQVLQAAPNEA